ncbi:MAG: hypothetical protein AAGA11_06450 [Pseudomonadota bacterium]
MPVVPVVIGNHGVGVVETVYDGFTGFDTGDRVASNIPSVGGYAVRQATA